MLSFSFLWEHGLVLPDVTLLLTLNLFFPWGVALYFLFAIGTIGVRGADGFLYVANAGILLGIVSIIALTAYFVERERWKSSYFLISSCFLVYACHQLPLNMFVRILFKFMSPVSDWQFMLIYIVSPLVIILVNLLLYASLKNFFHILQPLLQVEEVE
mgnify:CR=1 FL=1